MNSSARSLMEYSPVSCIRRSSFCRRSESLGCLPRSLPRARAMAMPSRVRNRMRSASKSAICGAPYIADYAERVVMRSGLVLAERRLV